MPAGNLITPSGYHRAWRALIAAKYSNANVSVTNFLPGVTDVDPKFTSKFPPSTVPVFEGDDGTNLFDANAIAYHLGNEELRGGQNVHLVTQWTNFTDNNVLPSVATWVYPCLGVTQYNKQSTDKAKAHLKSVLSYVNEYLRKATYLVGERITQADITLFTALQPLFTYVLDEKNRSSYPHLVRWFTTIANQPNVLSVVGLTKLCTKEAQFDAKKYAELHDKAGDKNQQSKKAKQEKPQAPKETKPAEADAEPAPPKSKNPFAALPDGGFDMDAFKKVYSNDDIATVAIPYFWQHFDPNTHSLWYCEYKYPEELNLLFMTSNLIGGMFQRLEKMIKYGFGIMSIFGKDKNNTIKGLWFWRGTGLAFELSEDLQIDYESYEWRKLDPASDEAKSMVQEYFLKNFSDPSFAQARVFK